MTSLDRESGLPLWRQIKDAVLEDIAVQALKAGDPLPTAGQLASRFGVNLHTARRALTELKTEGVAHVEKGRVPFLRTDRIRYPIGEKTRFRQNLLRQGKRPENSFIGHETLTAGSEIARLLQLSPQAKVVRLGMVGHADGVPISIGRSYLPLALFPEAVDVFERTCSMSAVWQHHRVAEYRRLGTRITSRLPTDEEVEQLRQPKSQPVLVTDYVDVDETGRRIGFAETSFSADLVQFFIGEESVFD